MFSFSFLKSISDFIHPSNSLITFTTFIFLNDLENIVPIAKITLNYLISFFISLLMFGLLTFIATTSPFFKIPLWT